MLYLFVLLSTFSMVLENSKNPLNLKKKESGPEMSLKIPGFSIACSGNDV